MLSMSTCSALHTRASGLPHVHQVCAATFPQCAEHQGCVQERYQPAQRCCSLVQVAALTLKWLVLPAAAEVAPYMPVDSQTLQLEGMELQLKVWWPGVSCQPVLPLWRSSVM